MKNVIFLLSISLFSLLYSCGCDTSGCKFRKGDDVEIKNKWRHDNATILEVNCDCKYEISYYSYLGISRHRVVDEVEIE